MHRRVSIGEIDSQPDLVVWIWLKSEQEQYREANPTIEKNLINLVNLRNLIIKIFEIEIVSVLWCWVEIYMNASKDQETDKRIDKEWEGGRENEGKVGKHKNWAGPSAVVFEHTVLTRK